jgi:Transposase, Mutator family
MAGIHRLCEPSSPRHTPNRRAHIAFGIDMDGIKHVLGIWIQTSEGAKFWPEYAPTWPIAASATC